MSKERALLKEVLYVIGEYTEDAQERTEILIAEIEKLLAQPEQEPEPEQSNKWWYGKGVEDTKYFLKREPLSTKQAEDLWETTFKSAVPYYIFDEICTAIEQYHEIGGGEC